MKKADRRSRILILVLMLFILTVVFIGIYHELNTADVRAETVSAPANQEVEQAKQVYFDTLQQYYNSELDLNELMLKDRKSVIAEEIEKLHKVEKTFANYYWQASLLYLLGEIEQRLGNKEQAESIYFKSMVAAKNALDLDLFSGDANRLYGKISLKLVKQNNAQIYGRQADSYFRRAFNFDRENFGVFNDLAVIAAYIYPDGEEKTQRLIGLYGIGLESKDRFDRFNAHFQLGQIYLKRGEREQALKHLGAALRIFPKNRWVNQLIDQHHADRSLLMREPAIPANPATSGEFEAARLKWKDFLTGGEMLNPGDPDIAGKLKDIAATAKNYWETMNKNEGRSFLWKDISDFSSTGIITNNYLRLEAMTLAYTIKGSKYEQNQELLADIINALDWLYQNRYNEKILPYENLWNLEIGPPLALNNIVVMLYDKLSEPQIANYMKAVKHFSPSVKIYSNGPATGANRVWKCMVLGLRGIIVKDAQEVAAARDGLSDVFQYVASGDGFYRDGSFIQHGRHPYTGGYGASLIMELANVMYLLNDSPWDITDPARENVYRWIYDSFEPLIYKGAMMDMVRGRENARYGSQDHIIGHQVIKSILVISEFAPARDSLAFKQMVKYWVKNDSYKNFYSDASIKTVLLTKKLLADSKIEPRSELVKHKQFPAMDRVIHLRPGFRFGISMSSKRIYNYESLNTENSKGWYTGDGMTYLYNNDLAQYSDDFWPTINPYRLPGTTVSAVPRRDSSGQRYLSDKAWVGGAVLEGFYGVAGMELQSYGSSLTARKSWFMFDDEVVALGSGITCNDAHPVETIVENRKMGKQKECEITIDGKVAKVAPGWSEKLGSTKWFHIEGLGGYYLPNGGKLNGLFETRNSSWSVISNYPKYTSSNPVSNNFVTFWFDHGQQPNEGTYAYVVLPNKSRTEVELYSKEVDITILENSREAQAVRENKLKILAVNFWEDKLKTVDWITSDKKAAVIVREADGELILSVADPTQENAGEINLTFNKTGKQLIQADPRIKAEFTEQIIKLRVSIEGARGESITARIKL